MFYGDPTTALGPKLLFFRITVGLFSILDHMIILPRVTWQVELSNVLKILVPHNNIVRWSSVR